MALLRFLQSLAGHHLLPALFASGAVYLLLSVVFGPLRLRKPAHRVACLYAALVKMALALWAGEAISCLGHPHRFRGFFGVSLPNLLPDGTFPEPRQLIGIPATSELAGWVFWGVLLLGLVLLCRRWARLAPVYQLLFHSRRVEPLELPDVFLLFDDLVRRAYGTNSWLPRPKLMVVREASVAAFTMGVRSPVVVLSATLVSHLKTQELLGLLAHELGHVRRFDYLGRWLMRILCDLMLWNPLTWLWHQQLIQEQERAADAYGATLLCDPEAVASGLLVVALHAQGCHAALLEAPAAWQWQAKNSVDRLQERLDSLRLMEPDGKKRVRWLLPVLGVLFLTFLAFQPRVVISLPAMLSCLKL